MKIKVHGMTHWQTFMFIRRVRNKTGDLLVILDAGDVWQGYSGHDQGTL